MKIFCTIILVTITSHLLQAQMTGTMYQTCIKIEWERDTTHSYRYLQDSVEYGFLGFYETENLKIKSLVDFINDSLNCPADSAGQLIKALIMGFKPLYFCDSIQPVNNGNPSIGLYHTTHTGGLTSRGTMLEYHTNSVYRKSDNNFLLIMVMRDKATHKFKAIVVRDLSEPQSYILTFKVDFFDFKTMPEICYFDLTNSKNKFYPSKITNETSGNHANKLTHKTIYNFSEHQIPLTFFDEKLTNLIMKN